MVKFQYILALWAVSLGAAKAYGGRDALGAITFYLVSYFTTQLFVMSGKVYVLLRNYLLLATQVFKMGFLL